ncbi:PREDICTED: probable carbohydrate esterase At4g34215 [Nicotiana attenuata]|uniref:Carbohydrate esterase n=1 Tax=Nicotiana attenuata TaxID=49451 RepID=A0A314KHC5_NICAT|nr:PREDICTED: probable carbohydrate esterase At4g34215 [Nicotiana attenuata]OIT28683.1 putative carbohydrate esterase [Nicotiana attenuata]
MVYRKTMLPYLLLVLLAHARWVSTADLANCSLVKNIFILAGQSNISGRGGVINHSNRPGVANETWDGVIPRECEANPSILRLSGGLTWVEAQEPLHKDIDVNNTCGIGPGMPFANTVLKRDPSVGVIGLVPCAVGGTSITEWAPGGFLYKQMIRRTKAATRCGGRVRALLWYQGESDTKTLEDAKMYKRRLESFFKHVRHDLQLPTLPVIQVTHGKIYYCLLRIHSICKL